MQRILKNLLTLLKNVIQVSCKTDPYPDFILYDRILLRLILILLCVGFITVTSASMPLGTRLYHDPLYFAKRDIFYLSISFILSLVTLHIPMAVWQRYSSIILRINIAMLLTVMIIGDTVNGASRWIMLGPLSIQPAELSKLALFCYLSSYLVRKAEEVRSNLWGCCKPMSVMLVLSVLLLAQPDLGTVVILFLTTLSMLFLAGAKIWQFISIISSGILATGFLIIAEPYRMQRIRSFWNPWEDPFGNGYQLTQSLMAFGRGQLWGQGLGNSVQKLEYLPEAHTDFIFAIIGEELGYIGVFLALLVVFLVAFRAMTIGRNAIKINQLFSGFLACSIGIWFGLQSLVNIGAAAGIFPPKGLTLPLVSYGGSSLLIMSTAIVFLLRIDFETRITKAQAISGLRR